MSKTQPQSKQPAAWRNEEKRLMSEMAAAKLRGREVTEQLSARAAAQARKATSEAAQQSSWRSILLVIVVLVVIVLAVYAGIRLMPIH